MTPSIPFLPAAKAAAALNAVLADTPPQLTPAQEHAAKFKTLADARGEIVRLMGAPKAQTAAAKPAIAPPAPVKQRSAQDLLTVSRESFEGMSAQDRVVFLRGGGKVKDEDSEPASGKRTNWSRGPNPMRRAEFEQLAPKDKMRFIVSGGKLTD